MAKVSAGYATKKDRCIMCDRRTDYVVEWWGASVRVRVYACDKHKEGLDFVRIMEPVLRSARAAAQDRLLEYDLHKRYMASHKRVRKLEEMLKTHGIDVDEEE